MQSNLVNNLYKLKEEIEKDKRVVLLNSLEDELNNNEDVMRLAYKKDMCLVDYEDALKFFKSDSKEVSLAQEKLYKAKLELDSHPLVIKYNKAYKDVRLLYKKISFELFGEFLNVKN